MFKNKRFLLIAILACILGSLGAQTHSPYSRYGYGILKDNSTGVSKGMGGVAYGIRNSLSANVANPASYSAVDSLTFLFDVGLYANRSTLKDSKGSRSDYNGGLDYITFLLPLSNKLGFSGGVIPYSTVGYDYGAIETINETTTYSRTYNGSGGISQVYLGLGYKLPVEGLSAGFNVSYMFGKLKHNRSLPSISLPEATSYMSMENTELRVSTVKLDLGFQYDFKIDKKNSLTLGFTYSPQMNSKADYVKYYREYNSAGELMQSDTTRADGENAGVPHTIGLGGAWTHSTHWLVAADITFQKWDGVKYSTLLNDGMKDSDRFRNRWRYNVGAEYVMDKYNRSFFKKIKFRGGANYSNSYMNVTDEHGAINGYNEYGASFGLGLPILDRQSFGNRTSYINVNFEYKKIKPKASNMIAENYYGISVSANLNELWFYKKKIQ